MSKVTLQTVSSGSSSTTLINQNFQLIQSALDTLLSRDGTAPNTMGADLDMNSNEIINVSAPTTPNSAARLADLSTALSVATAPSAIGNDDKFLKSNGTSTPVWDRVDQGVVRSFSTNSYQRKLQEKLYEKGVTPLDFTPSNVELRRLGTASQSYFQEAIDFAASFYSPDQDSLATDSATIMPAVFIPPGHYMVDDEILWRTGVYVYALGVNNTVNHTRILMGSTTSSGGAGDNRNKYIFRATRKRADGQLLNTAFTARMENLELGFVTGSNDILSPFSGAGIASLAGAPYTGACIYFGVPAADVRIANMNFQHSSAAIFIEDILADTSNADDGASFFSREWAGYIHDCEFDAGAYHLRAKNSKLDLHFYDNEAFDDLTLIEDCWGNFSCYDNDLFSGARIEVNNQGAANKLSYLRITDNEIAGGGDTTTPRIYTVNTGLTIVDDNIIYSAQRDNAIRITDSDAGSVSNNKLDNCGFNATASTTNAAILLEGVRQTSVKGNTLTNSTGTGTFNSNGILSISSASRSPLDNHYEGNHVTAPYNGADHRGQTRYINIDTANETYGPNSTIDATDELYKVRSNTALAVQSNALVNKSTKTGNFTYDLAANISDEGTYKVLVRSQPTSNLTIINEAEYNFTKRASGGYGIVELGVNNRSGAGGGAISFTGSTLSFNHGGSNFVVTIEVHILNSRSIRVN